MAEKSLFESIYIDKFARFPIIVTLILIRIRLSDRDRNLIKSWGIILGRTCARPLYFDSFMFFRYIFYFHLLNLLNNFLEMTLFWLILLRRSFVQMLEKAILPFDILFWTIIIVFRRFMMWGQLLKLISERFVGQRHYLIPLWRLRLLFQTFISVNFFFLL